MEFIIMTRNKVIYWPTKKLMEVCDIIYGFAFKASAFNETGKGLPVIRIGDVDKSKTNKFFDGKYDEKYLVKKGDILLGLSGSFKAFRWEGDTALLNQRVATLRNFENDIVESFVFYQIPRLFVQLEKIITQLSVKNILTKHLENLKILYPPLKIQQKIVERLDAIKKAQKLNDKQIKLAEELFQSLLYRELDPKGKNWDLVKLGNVVQKIEYGLSVSVQDRLDENGVPILTMAEIENDGQINYQKARKISVSADELKKFKINKGELLFNWRNEKALIGKTGLFESEKDFIFASFLLRIVTNEKILPEFLWYRLNYLRTKKAYLQYAHLAGNQASYNANSLRSKISCPLISIKNQQKIVEKLSAVQDYKKKLLEQKQKLQELFESVLNKTFQHS
jgi:type I restriction enzyme S subunit